MHVRLPRIVALSGSTRRPSRSRSLAEAVAQAAAERIEVVVKSYDLIDAGPGLGAAFTREELSPEALAIIEDIENADALIAVSPVYKGSYAGLFKHLFDFVSPESLPASPLSSARRRRAPAQPRRGASVAPALRVLLRADSATSVYASDHEFLDGRITDPGVRERAGQAASQLARLLLPGDQALGRTEQARTASATAA